MMVAISFYRGNLHRVSDDVPRRWRMPPPRFSLSDFRSLLQRRSAALINPNPNPNPNIDSTPPAAKQDEESEEGKDEEFEIEVRGGGDVVMGEEEKEEEEKVEEEEEEEVVVVKNVEGDRGVEEVTATATAMVVKDSNEEGLERSDTVEVTNKRKREIEEKLQLSNAKKHNLVQALKQILNAEEELKRRNTAQAIRPPVQLQVDVTGAEGAEADDISINNPESRPLLRMNSSSPSPSSDSVLRRTPYFQHNMASNTPRAATTGTPSPSRFAQHGNLNQGQSPNPSTVSIPGTNYPGSLPSPAASGGTPGYRDARHPSPWS